MKCQRIPATSRIPLFKRRAELVFLHCSQFLRSLQRLSFLSWEPHSSFAEEAQAAPQKQEASLLECRPVHPDNNQLANKVKNGSETCPKGYELLWEYEHDEKGDLAIGDDGLFIGRPILVMRQAIVTSSDIEKVTPDFDRPGTIIVTLTNKGGKAMMRYTNSIVPGRDRMAHVLNGKVLNAPGFQSKSLGKSFIITGIPGGNAGANKLCNEIMAGNQKDLPE